MAITLKENFSKALSFLSSLLKDNDLEWFVIGKTNLALQGLDFNPSKIGILIHSEDFDSFIKIFKAYLSSPVIELKNGEAKEFFLNILDTDIQVCAEYPNGTYWKVKNEIITIPIGKTIIKGFSLESEAQAYGLLGEKFTKEKIEGFLTTKRATLTPLS